MASSPRPQDLQLLAQRIERGEEGARLEARAALLDLADQLARRTCSKLGHRAAPCPGLGCDLAYTAGLRVHLDAMVGRAPDPELSHARARLGRASLLVGFWRRGGAEWTWFKNYVAKLVHDDDVRRAWNDERGLPQRFRLTETMRRLVPDYYVPFLEAEAAIDAANRLGHLGLKGFETVACALYRDACDTGLADPIDFDRVTRAIVPRDDGMGRETRRDALVLALAVDKFVSIVSPEWAETFGRARSLTRTCAEYPTMGIG